MKAKYLLPLAASLLTPGLAQADTVRPAIAKYLLLAETDVKGQKYDAALAALTQADRIGHLSAYETLVVAQLRGAAAGGAGQYPLAAASYETVLASGATPPGETLLLLQAISGFYAQAGDNAQTIVWVNKYIAAGGKDAQTRALAVQADYTLGHYQQVAQDAKRDGAAAPVSELQLAALAAQKSGDNQGYFDALQKLLKAAPSPAYWNQAISLVQSGPGFPDALTLDVYRLRLTTNTLTQPGDYEDYAERAILAGQPVEARNVLDAGFASDVLTAQTDNGHAARLRKLATAKAATPQPATAQGGTALDTAIASGQGFSNVPGYDQDQITNPQAALSRLWSIAAGQSRAN